MTGKPSADRTVVEVHTDPDGRRARCRTVGGALAARILETDGKGARVALVATRALLLAGDHVEIDFVVGPGAWLEVSEITGTVAYDADGAKSSWSLSARIAAQGSLLWDAPPFVVATGADVTRTTVVDLAPGSCAGWREAVVMGRTGETGGRIRTTTLVTTGAVPILIDEVVLGDADVDLVTLGSARVVDTATVVGFRPPWVTEDGRSTRLELSAPGATARHLVTRAHESALDETWPVWVASVRANRGARAGEGLP